MLVPGTNHENDEAVVEVKAEETLFRSLINMLEMLQNIKVPDPWAGLIGKGLARALLVGFRSLPALNWLL
jgi:hypothetical protein